MYSSVVLYMMRFKEKDKGFSSILKVTISQRNQLPISQLIKRALWKCTDGSRMVNGRAKSRPKFFLHQRPCHLKAYLILLL